MKKRKKLIVLVEDEQTLANLIELGLEREGYSVKAAGNGLDGLNLIRKSKPDLVLLDLMLPGLKGFDILEKLYKDDHVLPALPVIIISNSGDSMEIKQALRMGVKDYLIKINFNPYEVVEKVNNVLEAEKYDSKKGVKKPKTAKENRVLIIEDDPILSGTLEKKFVEKEYVVYTAFNANSAREILKKEKIDAILLDLVLPDEHGLGFLRELKKDDRTNYIPVIITSNLGQQEEIEQGLQAGAADYIVKTNTLPGEIFEKVDSLLQQQKK